MTMLRPKMRNATRGFSLLETMIALVVLGVGVLGLAAMLANALSYMQGSEETFIAQQQAEEAAESIFTAKYTNASNWAAISNNTGANPAGLFLTGPQPILQPGPDGLVGSINDTGASAVDMILPGPDGKLGTADDIKTPLNNFTRTITITNVAGDANLRQVQITVNYKINKQPRAYTLNTYISAFN